MADPLTEVTDQFAPAPLNFFDAGRAQSITSRYANSRRGLEASTAALGAAKQAQDFGIDRERQERQRILADRDDLDYADRLTNREERAGFLEDLDGFDVSDPEANTKLTGVLKGIAERTPALLEDPVTKEFMALKFRQIDKADAERQRIADQQRRQDFTIEAIRERQKGSKTLANLTDEDLKNAPRDADGNIDMLTLGIIAGRRERANEMEDFGKKVEITTAARKELLNEGKMDDTQKALYKETKDILINDREAFPSRVSMVQAKAAANPKHKNLALDQLKEMPEYAKDIAAAEEWDKNMFENEVLTAQNYDTPEKYIEARGAEITPNAANRRRRVWEYAHQNDGAPTSEAPSAPSAPSAPPSEAPQIKVLDGTTYIKKPGGGWAAVRAK